MALGERRYADGLMLYPWSVCSRGQSPSVLVLAKLILSTLALSPLTSAGCLASWSLRLRILCILHLRSLAKPHGFRSTAFPRIGSTGLPDVLPSAYNYPRIHADRVIGFDVGLKLRRCRFDSGRHPPYHGTYICIVDYCIRFAHLYSPCICCPKLGFLPSVVSRPPCRFIPPVT